MGSNPAWSTEVYLLISVLSSCNGGSLRWNNFPSRESYGR